MIDALDFYFQVMIIIIIITNFICVAPFIQEVQLEVLYN